MTGGVREVDRDNVPFGVASAREMHTRECVEPRRIAVRNFPRVAKLLWPVKTAATLAALVNTNPRTAERWVTGEVEPPISVALLTMQEIFRRD